MNHDAPASAIWDMAAARSDRADAFFVVVAFLGAAVVAAVGLLAWSGHVPRSVEAWSALAIVLAFLGALPARHFVVRAKDAAIGAEAEDDVWDALAPLRDRGWTIKRNVRLRGGGDVDFEIWPPRGTQRFAVDVKAAFGIVRYEGQKFIWRSQRGKTRRAPASAFLSACRAQAARLRESTGGPWVTPVLCFSDAEVRAPLELGGVVLVEGPSIAEALQSLTAADRSSLLDERAEWKWGYGSYRRSGVH